jgi:hypothetical protein
VRGTDFAAETIASPVLQFSRTARAIPCCWQLTTQAHGRLPLLGADASHITEQASVLDATKFPKFISQFFSKLFL